MVKKIKIIGLMIFIIISIGTGFLIWKGSVRFKSSANAKEEEKITEIKTNEKEEKAVDQKPNENGEKVVNQKPNLVNRINEYIAKNKLENNIFISVSSFKNGETYMHNVDADVFAASIYKVPLAMIYYELMNAGKLSLNDTLVYQSHHYEAGSAIGEGVRVGTKLHLETLLNYMIVYSDNTAGCMLYENLGGWVNFLII